MKSRLQSRRYWPRWCQRVWSIWRRPIGRSRLHDVARKPEQPRWALVVKPYNRIEVVLLANLEREIARGGFVIAREDWLLPFNPPKMVERIDNVTDEGDTSWAI